jgi:hypothetical protein
VNAAGVEIELGGHDVKKETILGGEERKGEESGWCNTEFNGFQKPYHVFDVIYWTSFGSNLIGTLFKFILH